MKNYTLIEQKEIPELHATGYLYRHELTGARCFCLYDPEDDNQVFSISFATPPQGDMGIPHILEHCVLNGSDKYPVKEPFVELLKGSLNTFLNAMTFPDKTMFPVASRNEKDFMNLMGVYLDAVFFPNLRKDPFIFAQEGWHYELDSPEGEIVYKGVVYNEMKGAYSSGDEVLSHEINKAIFPDSIYGLESGGHPDHIPELTYEQFRDFHERYYHPSNSFIFLYGNGDMEKHLAFIDEEYLCRFETAGEDKLGAICLQQRLGQKKEVRSTYSVSEEEGTEEKTYLSYNVMLDPAKDARRYQMMELVSNMLTESEASPVKRALLEAGVGQDISCSVSNYILQPVLSIVAKNADEDQKEQFVAIVESVLEEIGKKGFDAKLLESTLSSSEFSLREANFGSTPKGLVFGMQCMDSWLYGGDPMEFLGYEKEYRSFRQDPGQFAEFVQKELVEGDHKAIVVLAPEPGLNTKVDAEVKARLAKYKASLTKEEIDDLVGKTSEIKARQQQPDDPSDLLKIPMLSREDLQEVKPFEPAAAKEVDGCLTFYYNGFTNNIIYMGLHFDMDHLPEEYIPYASLLTECLSMMDTSRRTYMDLDNEIGCHLGGLNISNRLIRKLDGDFKPVFEISAKFLSEETDSAAELIKEILTETCLDDSKRLNEIIQERVSRMEDAISYRGDKIAASRALSYFVPYQAYNDRMGGLDFFFFVKEIAADFDNRSADVIKKMKEALEILLYRGGLTCRICTDEDKQVTAEGVLESVLDVLPSKPSELASEEVVRVRCEVKNEGLITPGKVQYVARAGRADPKLYSGSMLVMMQILRLDYLWNKVRAQGGAYGCSGSINRHGEVVMSSFRDPNLKETVDTFENAGASMEGFEADEREMLKYIIGTMAGLDPVQTINMKAAMAFDALVSGLTGEMITDLSKQVMAATPETVREAAAALSQAMKDPYLCVQGSEGKIKECADLFGQTVTLF